jgi:hypothetical protein
MECSTWCQRRVIIFVYNKCKSKLGPEVQRDWRRIVSSFTKPIPRDFVVDVDRNDVARDEFSERNWHA